MNPLELLSIINKIKPILESPRCRKSIEHQDGIVSLIVTAPDSEMSPTVLTQIDALIKTNGGRL